MTTETNESQGREGTNRPELRGNIMKFAYLTNLKPAARQSRESIKYKQQGKQTMKITTEHQPADRVLFAAEGGSLEDSANARLIASAPDLLHGLKAAKEVLETAKRYFPKSIKNADKFHLLNVLENVIRPAIEKAEG